MLISEKIKKTIESEVKAQQTLLKLLVNQEQNYNVDCSKEKEAIEESIAYYNKVIRDAA